MLRCQICGRWILALNWPAHHQLHESQLLLDHTGPHGTCEQIKVAPPCRCPDPIYLGGQALCTCCDGTLNVVAPSNTPG